MLLLTVFVCMGDAQHTVIIKEIKDVFVTALKAPEPIFVFVSYI